MCQISTVMLDSDTFIFFELLMLNDEIYIFERK